MYFIKGTDFQNLIAVIVSLPILAYIFARLIIFVPSFMQSIVKKIFNPSPIYSETTLEKGIHLDYNTLHKKTMIERELDK